MGVFHRVAFRRLLGLHLWVGVRAAGSEQQGVGAGHSPKQGAWDSLELRTAQVMVRRAPQPSEGGRERPSG